jgi:hypothetical protein
MSKAKSKVSVGLALDSFGVSMDRRLVEKVRAAKEGKK